MKSKKTFISKLSPVAIILLAQLSLWQSAVAVPSFQNAVTVDSTKLAAEQKQEKVRTPGKKRIYYIAADEIEWNYAPSDSDLTFGKPLSQEPMAKVYTQSSNSTIGSKYKKAIYREYTDSTFQYLKPRAAEWQHLGILGPVIRAEVGDTIHVFFKNNSTINTSVHPHGVFYEKSSEGAPTNDGTDGAGSIIAPGNKWHYIWTVPERSGPGPNDPSSIVWAYHGHADHSADEYAGLIGPIIVTRKGMADASGKPKDVDREFINLFMIFDENLSPYLRANAKTYITSKREHHDEHKDEHDEHEMMEHAMAGMHSMQNQDNDRDGDDGFGEEFAEGNKKHAINGFIFGNMPMMTMHKGEHVRWYLIGMGNEADIHTAHWHGATVTEHGNNEDVVPLFPATFKQVDMVPDDLGIWMYHCHVADHMMAGMLARYQVLP